MNPVKNTRTPTRTPIVQAVAGALLLLPLLACTDKTLPDATHTARAEAMPVSVTTVHRQMLPVALELVGQTEGSREVEVQTRVSGLLERTLFQEGEAVKAGAPLFMIERTSYEHARQQARADVAQRQTQLEQAQREVLRLKPLMEDKAIPQREYDDAVSNERLAAAALESARAALKNAELNLAYTSITAPISGITGRTLKSQGNLLIPGADGILTTIVQADPLWVRFSLSTAEMSRLRQTPKAEVKLTDIAGQTLLSGGRLNFTGSRVDARIGTVEVRAEFANPDLAVMPGQFVRVQLQAGETAGFRVPQTAVAQNEEGRMVWVVRDGKAVATPIEAGAWMGADWAIHKGLNEGDQVITDNLIKLSPDAAVAPRTVASQTSATPAGTR